MPGQCRVSCWMMTGTQDFLYISWSAWKYFTSHWTPCFTSQVRATSQTAEQERSLNDQSLQLLRDELARVKQSLSDCQRREGSVCLFITYCMTPSGCKILFSTLGFMFSLLMHGLYQILSMKWWKLCLAIHISSSHLINGFWLNFISLYSGLI